MPRLLSGRDYRAVLAAAQRVYEAQDPDDLAAVMLEVVGSLVGAEHLSYNELSFATNRAVSFFDQPDVNRLIPAYLPQFEKHLPDHPVAADYRRRQLAGHDAPVRKITDFLSRSRYRRLGLYQDCYRHLDTEFQLILSVINDPANTVGIAINRKLRDFSERDRHVLELLRPHLKLAYQSLLRRARLRRLFTPGEEEQVIKDLRPLGLTRREAQVLFYVAHGKTNAEIATILANRPRTVDKHVEHLFDKLHVNTRAGAIARVLELLDG